MAVLSPTARAYDEIDTLPGAMEARTRLVTISEEYLDALSREPGSDSALKLELASAWRKVGDSHGGQNSPGGGNITRAVESYGKSITLAEQVLASEPDNQRAGVVLTKALIRMGRTVLVTEGQEPALVHVERAAKLAEASPQGFDSEFERVNALTVLHRSLCEILMTLQRPDEALAHCDQLVTVNEAYAAKYPDDIQGIKLLRNAYTNSAIVVDPRRPPADALERTLGLMRKSLLVSERLLAIEPDSVEHRTRLAEQRFNLGDSYFNAEKYPEAIENFHLAAPVLAAAAQDKTDARAQLALGMNTTGLAASLMKLGDTKQAAPLFDASEQTFQAMVRSDPGNLLNLYQLAHVEFRRGQMYVLLAERAGNRSAQRDYWTRASSTLESGVTRMHQVHEKYALSGYERVALDEGVESLARTKEALAGFPR